MKVVIAAAGQGTRMQELTKERSKHLIEVAGRPFLAYLLDNLLRAGYKDIVLVVGFGADLIKDFLSKNNYKVKIINQIEVLGPKEKIYGTACPIMCVQNIIGREDFLYICGDNLYSENDLKAMKIKDRYNYVAGAENDNPENFGVLIQEGELLKEIIEKPQEFLGNLVNASLYKFTPEIFEKVSQINKSPRGEYEITDAVSLLAKEKKVKTKKIKDYWYDFGKPEDIGKISEFLKVKNIVGALKSGKVLVLPTDTVYGLVCDASNKKAVEKIFEIKKRDKSNPLPVFVSSLDMAKELAKIDQNQEGVINKSWPGATTFVLKTNAQCPMPKLLTKNGTIALRAPNYNLIQEILKEFKKPLAQTSANISGSGATVKIKEVLGQFSSADIVIIDEGDLPARSPSTIIDLTDNNIKVLRK